MTEALEMTLDSPKVREMSGRDHDPKRTERALLAGIIGVLIFSIVALGYVVFDILALVGLFYL